MDADKNNTRSGAMLYEFGRFRDPALERRFQQDVREVDRRQTVPILLFASLAFFAFLPIELLESHSSVAIATAIAARVSFLLLGLALAFVLLRHRNLIHSDLAVLLFIVGYCAASSAIFAYQDYMERATESYLMAAITYLVGSMGSYALFPARLGFQLAYSACFIIAFAVHSVMLPPSGGVHPHLVWVFFIAVNVVGLVFASRAHGLRRTQWLALEHERNIGEELKSEIEQRRQLERELSLQANTDPLTGIHNRRYCFEEGEAMVVRAQRYQRALAVLIFDIDHFKRINDTYGHDAGDTVLKLVAVTVGAVLRKADLICRHGGEEFAILAPETDARGAGILAERVRAAVENLELVLQEKPEKTTISVGATVLGSDDSGFADLVVRADAAMYDAKKRGRNTVVCSA
jgi:diguanylate cyclase (GGDEF)-like protein